MTKTELKARAYDVLSQIQFLQTQLNQINAEIAKPDASQIPGVAICKPAEETPKSE